MASTDGTKYLLLDGHQGLSPEDGWAVGSLKNVEAGRDGMGLAKAPPPAVPLSDDTGTFAGLENPTGVAVAPDGAVYASVGDHIVKIVARDGMRASAVYFRIAGGAYAGERFVFVPSAMRLERWPRSVKKEPGSFDEVEVICDNAWNLELARGMVMASIAPEQDGGCGCEECAQKQKKASGGGCGCGGTGKTAARSTGDCGCGGSGTTGGGRGAGSKGTGGGRVRNTGATAATKTADCGCSAKAAAESGRIASEKEGLYPEHLPAGTICGTSNQALRCLGGTGSEPRQFRGPRGLVISPGGMLYVADSGNHRVQAFSLRGLVLAEIWGRRATAADVKNAALRNCDAPAIAVGDPVAGSRLGEFDTPYDVTLDAAGDLYITDRGNGRVQKYDCRARSFRSFDGRVYAAHFFQVLYGPHFNVRYVYIPALRRLEKWSGAPGTVPANNGATMPLNVQPVDIRAARVHVLRDLDALGAKDLLVEWDAAYPLNLGAHAPFVHPEHLVVDMAGHIYVTDASRDEVTVIDAEGRVIGEVEFANDLQATFPPTSLTIGPDGVLLVAGPKGLHRFEGRGGRLEYGGQARTCGCAPGKPCSHGDTEVCGTAEGVRWIAPSPGYLKKGCYITRALDSGIDRCQWHRVVLEFADSIPDNATVTAWTYTSQTELSDADIAALADDEWRTGQINAPDFMVLSGPGQFMWLKIEISSDGASTPIITHITAHCPRVTYLQYLPAVYQSDPASKGFMERFLSIFETVFSSIEGTVGGLARYLDPEGVPPEFIAWLGSWVDMEFWPKWSIETRRNLLRHSAELYRLRGTPEGLRRMVKLALGIDIRIQEAFRQRNWQFLSRDGSLGTTSELWGKSIVPRLQLDEFASIGEFQLISTGDPYRDPFHVYAHRFTVFVNAGDLRNADVERALRYMIGQEKPAHTAFTLVKVEPRFRVGVQATIGLDTTIGTYPKTVLNECATLGCDTLLGQAPEDVGPETARVGARTRVGVDVVVG